MDRAYLDSLSNSVIGAAIEVHSILGPGLLESVYEHCLCEELTKRKIPFERQKFIEILYKKKKVGKSFAIDILVDKTLCLELKTVEKILPIHQAQLLTYLKLTDNRLGLILNFNVEKMQQGIQRMVYRF